MCHPPVASRSIILSSENESSENEKEKPWLRSCSPP
jgi:hypothetical protein